uniref:Uncharacterized protein n=1 Tax=Physcomitrium patens TaxID=3218 RepID=A0A2K1J290_PHYPA|nr:hypothetical protein PHYPA_021487 [Physcomitrium patens]
MSSRLNQDLVSSDAFAFSLCVSCSCLQLTSFLACLLPSSSSSSSSALIFSSSPPPFPHIPLFVSSPAVSVLSSLTHPPPCALRSHCLLYAAKIEATPTPPPPIGNGTP